MLDYVAGELRNPRISTTIGTWLNAAVLETAIVYEFSNLNTYAAFAMQPGIPDQVLPTNFLWPKVFLNPVRRVALDDVEEQTLARTQPDYRTLVGTTDWYYLNGQTVGLYHVPNTNQTINYQYQAYPVTVDVTKLTMYAGLPREWHRYICQCAITMGYDYDRNNDASVKSTQYAEAMLKKLGASKYRRPDKRDVLSGPGERSGRPGRPKLPYNIPIP